MNKAHIVLARTGSATLVSDAAQIAAASLDQAGWTHTMVNLTPRPRRPGAEALHWPDFDPQDERASVAGCDLLVLAFPLVWSSMPAAMKQWIESVFCDAPGQDSQAPCCRGCLRGKKAIVVVASEGAEGMERTDSIEAAMADMLRPLLEGTLHYLGFHVLRPVCITGLTPTCAMEADRLLEEIAEVFLQIEKRSSFYGLMQPHPGRLSPLLL